MNNKHLKLCPFCDREAKIYKSDDNKFKVMCTHCKSGTGYSSSVDKVIDNWNMRVAHPNKKGMYSIYDTENNQIVLVGNTQECVDFLQITRESFYSLVCNCRKGKNKGSRRYQVFRYYDDEEV